VAAFEGAPYSDGNGHRTVRALGDQAALIVSPVAEGSGGVMGHGLTSAVSKS
jgi:hypothetical protein